MYSNYSPGPYIYKYDYEKQKMYFKPTDTGGLLLFSFTLAYICFLVVFFDTSQLPLGILLTGIFVWSYLPPSKENYSRGPCE